ncbi:MAG: undecaprenyl-diphosphate phosphatase [Firmicutes bacterium]|nr:undecaprenyl-diphosphate phosphatase [Bacillota bacterium]
MDYLKASVLGLVQGLTEFLPVSSSGHLILLDKVGFGESEMPLFFSLMLHVATLLAVVIVYRKKLWQLIKNPLSKESLFLIIATIPTIIIAVIFRFAFSELLTGKWLALGFMITALTLTSAELFKRTGKELTHKSSLITGIVQGIAVLPGISRSGATISAQMLMGIDKEEAAHFSFLLSIPIIIGGAIVESFGLRSAGIQVDIGPLLVGMAIAFASGFVVVRFFVALIKKLTFYPFAVYTFGLAILCLIIL